MTEFLFFIAHYAPFARAKLRQFVTNLRTAQNWKQLKKTSIRNALHDFSSPHNKSEKQTARTGRNPNVFKAFRA